MADFKNYVARFGVGNIYTCSVLSVCYSEITLTKERYSVSPVVVSSSWNWIICELLKFQTTVFIKAWLSPESRYNQTSSQISTHARNVGVFWTSLTGYSIFFVTSLAREWVGEWLRDKALSMTPLSYIARNKRMRPKHKSRWKLPLQLWNCAVLWPPYSSYSYRWAVLETNITNANTYDMGVCASDVVSTQAHARAAQQEFHLIN
jgi:hypothetical protein